jgi:hypothetical protein
MAGDPVKLYSRSTARFASIAILAMAAYPLREQDVYGGQASRLTLKSKSTLREMSPLSGAIYQKPTGVEMIKQGGFSPDNGRTWQTMTIAPDFDGSVPYGYRREPFVPWCDPVNGNILLLLNCMDTAGKDPRAEEPLWQWYWYYLRYRVSKDGGRSYLFDDPIVQDGGKYSAEHPIRGVHIGRNCFFLGDSGCRPIRTRQGTLLVPIQLPPLNRDGEGFYNPGGGWYWLDSLVLIGRWTADDHIVWDASDPISGDGERTARGLYEPTLAQFKDGTILCVMRGSNGGPRDPSFRWPSHKWVSTSRDGGHRWSRPEPWTYSDGEPFFSPASMSELFTHSSGRVYWIGNLSATNCRANHPRWPLVIGEVDGDHHRLIRESVLVIDSKSPNEPDVNLSHWHSFEDRESGDIVIPMARATGDYTSREPVVYVIGVGP